MTAYRITFRYEDMDSEIQVYTEGISAVAGYVEDALRGDTGPKIPDKIVIDPDSKIPV